MIYIYIYMYTHIISLYVYIYIYIYIYTYITYRPTRQRPLSAQAAMSEPAGAAP